MIHKWLADLFDTVLFLGLMFGLLLFFLFYWEGSYKVRQAEQIIQEFLNKASTEGRISSQDYAALRERLDAEYEIQVTCASFNLQPVYARIPEMELRQYYMSRNSRKVVNFERVKIQVKEENAEELRMQTESNAAILAETKEYLPVPEAGTGLEIQAVRKIQEIYKGETLITLCRITSGKGSYYAVAEPICPETSGQTFLTLTLDGEIHHIPVEVICHPREVICTNGHNVVNSKEILEKTKQTGKLPCPYCAVVPKTMECSTIYLSKRAGEDLHGSEVWVDVTYLDGHVERITPESKEWQDNYDKNFCGLQLVTIYYRDWETTMTVLTENTGCRQCLAPCNDRCSTDYESFPYCIGCMSQVPLYTGIVKEEEQWFGNSELAAVLDKSGEILLQTGDYINISLKRNGICKSIMQATVKRNGRSR